MPIKTKLSSGKGKRSHEPVPEHKNDFNNLSAETKQGIIGLILLLVGLLILLSFFNLGGVVGNFLNGLFNSLFGAGMYLVPLSLFLAGIGIFKSLNKNLNMRVLAGTIVFFVAFLSLLGFGMNGTVRGGLAGHFIAVELSAAFGNVPAVIVLLGILIICILVIFDISLFQVGNLFRRKVKEEPENVLSVGEQLKLSLNGNAAVREELADGSGAFSAHPINAQKLLGAHGAEEHTMPLIDAASEGEKDAATEPAPRGGFAVSGLAAATAYEFPPVSLLNGAFTKPSSGDIMANANIIKKALANFGIPVEMAEVNVGPAVTQYTLKPDIGVKLSRIVALQSDLAMALAAKSLRIEAPIPGRSLVGVEIPNQSPSIVRLGNILKEKKPENAQPLSLALGRDVSGKAVWARLDKMPHLLIAGATGAGKSIALNSIITTFLFHNSPATLRMILVDPKRVELTLFNGIPHLLAPVVTDPKKTVNALKWAIGEMERRYSVLSAMKVRDIESYNGKMKQGGKDPMPYIVVIIDELADIMVVQGREVEAAIVRIAQMARAVGIHLIVSTQRPSIEVITGLIKANIPARIAFQVPSQIDSRTILDMAGAEKLLGRGDMLFLSGDATKPTRIQGTYLDENEVKKIVGFVTRKNQPITQTAGNADKEAGGNADEDAQMLAARAELAFDAEGGGSHSAALPDFMPGGSSVVDFDVVADGEEYDDDLYGEARKIVIQSKKASASLLQRRLRVGYARAARLLDMLEEHGIIGPGDGAKPREILVSGEDGE